MGRGDDQLVDQLARVSLFEGVSKKGLRRIGQMARIMTFAPGEELTTEAAKGSRFHLILEGRTKVVVGGRTRATLGPGDTLGEMALIDGGPRTATVVATEPVRTLSLASWNFRGLLREEPAIMEKVLLHLVHRLRAAEGSPVA